MQEFLDTGLVLIAGSGALWLSVQALFYPMELPEPWNARAKVIFAYLLSGVLSMVALRLGWIPAIPQEGLWSVVGALLLGFISAGGAVAGNKWLYNPARDLVASKKAGNQDEPKT